MLSQVQVYLSQNPGDAAMTIEHMRHLFRSGSPQAQQLIQRMCRYGANITGSRPYWYAKQQELQAVAGGNKLTPIQQQMHDQINCKNEY